MAGEWIKISSNLHTKPEVFKLARLLGEGVDTTVGLLLRFWCWADGVTVDGVVDAVESRDVDAVVAREGFCQGLIDVGWVQITPSNAGIEIKNFSRHNGESAKKRGLKNERQARWRAGKVDTQPSTKASTREEKRREERTTSTDVLPEWVPKDAWQGYVEMRVKSRHPLTDRAKALELKTLERLKTEGHDPRAVLDEAVAKCWRGLYPPKGGPRAADLGHYK